MALQKSWQLANAGKYPSAGLNLAEPLIDRLGGEDRLAFLVSEVYDSMDNDKDLHRFFDDGGGRRRNMDKLKSRTVDYLGGIWGGRAYRGPDLFSPHAGLGVNDKVMDFMIRSFAATFKKMKVPADAVKIMMDDIELMRGPICDTNKKFAEAAFKKMQALGDPFDQEALAKARAEQDALENARKEKMAKFKREKKERERKEEEARKAAEKAKADQALLKKKQADDAKLKAAAQKKEEDAKAKETQEAEAQAAAQASAAASAAAELAQADFGRRQSLLVADFKSENSEETRASSGELDNVALQRPLIRVVERSVVSL